MFIFVLVLNIKYCFHVETTIFTYRGLKSNESHAFVLLFGPYNKAQGVVEGEADWTSVTPNPHLTADKELERSMDTSRRGAKDTPRRHIRDEG